MDLGTGIGSDGTQAKPDDGAGNPAAPGGGNANGSGDASGNTKPSPDDTGELNWAKAKGWVNDDGSLKGDDVAKGYQALERQIGSMVKMPDDKAKPEEWDAFHKRMGWPGDPSKYEFKPDNLPADLPYNQGLAEWFRNTANEERLAGKTAQNIHDKFMGFAKQQYEADVAAFAAQVTNDAKSAHQTFVKEWGATDTEAYKANQEAARRAVSADPKLAGLVDALKGAGLMTKEGNFANFALGHLLASHGKQFMNDSFVQPNGQGRAEGNPFDKGSPSYNLTEQVRLVKQSPDQARTLIVAAGRNPKDYGLP